MKRLAAFLMACVLTAGCGTVRPAGRPVEPRDVSGILTGDTVWEGHVRMTGDVLVPAGSVLAIRAGTTVTVRVSESTKIDPEYLSSATELLVRGALRVDGRPARPVTFVPETAQDSGEPAWAGIILDRSATSSVRHARLLLPETGLTIIDTSPDVVGNVIRKARYGIVIQGGAARILDNEIALGEGGIFCWNEAVPYLKGNRVTANAEEGIAVDRSSRPWLDRNVVSGNAIGLIVPAGLPHDATMIAGNGEDIRLLPVRTEAAR